MKTKMDIEEIRSRCLKAIAPLRSAGPGTPAEKHFLFTAKRTDAGRSLPPYYLVYFLLVDLLGFRNFGQFEKVAWSVPVEYNGKVLLIEHRKFGLGIFAGNVLTDDSDAAEVVKLIQKATRAARPYFDWRAEQAVKQSKLNVTNRSRELFARFEFFAELYETRHAEAERRRNERVEKRIGENATSISFPASALRSEARWFALSAIECFFSWTEHVFIHLAILQGQCSTGKQVAELAGAEWRTKFKAALDLNDPISKRLYDELAILRRQLRNFIAHGAFGKDGEAFSFHSTAGAVPLLLPYKRDRSTFQFGQGVELVPDKAIALIRTFIDHLWSGSRAPAWIYIQDYELPLILTKAASGEYARAMTSREDMEEYARYEAELIDRYANMDF